MTRISRHTDWDFLKNEVPPYNSLRQGRKLAFVWVADHINDVTLRYYKEDGITREDSEEHMTIEEAALKGLFSSAKILGIIKETDRLIALDKDHFDDFDRIGYVELCRRRYVLIECLRDYEYKHMMNGALTRLFYDMNKTLHKNNFPYSITFIPRYDSNSINKTQFPLSLEFNAYVFNGNRNEQDRPLLRELFEPMGVVDSAWPKEYKWLMHSYFSEKAIKLAPVSSEWVYNPSKREKHV